MTLDVGAAILIAGIVAVPITRERLARIRIRNSLLVSVIALLTGVAVTLGRKGRTP